MCPPLIKVHLHILSCLVPLQLVAILPNGEHEILWENYLMNSNLSVTICISRSRSDSSHPGAYSAPWKNSCFQISSSRVQLRKTKLNHPFAKLEEEIGKLNLKETPAKFFENIYVMWQEIKLSSSNYVWHKNVSGLNLKLIKFLIQWKEKFS